MLSSGLLGKVAVTVAATAVLVGGPAAAQPHQAPTHAAQHPKGHGQAKGHAKQDEHAEPDERAEPDQQGTHGPVGPDATGPAAHGLCTAYAHRQHGRSLGHSIAMRNLARAAGGTAHIGAYCATVR